MLCCVVFYAVIISLCVFTLYYETRKDFTRKLLIDSYCLCTATCDGSTDMVLVDDGVPLDSLVSKSAGSSPLMCFRVVHVQPKRRKTHVSATNELRSDMLAISLYEITNRNRADRTLWVQSQMEDEAGEIRLLAYEQFLRIGMETLKHSTIASALSSEASYHFEGAA